MIFSTLNQLNCFFIFLFFGIILGIINTILRIILFINFNKKIKNNIFNCIFYCFFVVFFEILINILNFGKISLALVISFVGGFLLIKKLTLKLVVFLQGKCYNAFIRRKNLKCKEKE